MTLRFDIFAAALTLLGAVAVSGFAYRRLLEVEYPKYAALQEIPVGLHEHFVLQGGKCVGKFESEFKIVPQTTIISNGELRFSYRGNISTAKTFVGTYFNMLDQMVACNLSLTVENGKLEVKALNPNPISVELKADFGDRHVEQHGEIPGPVLMRNNGDGTYRIDYSVWSSVLGSAAPIPAHDSLKSLDISIVPAEQAPDACKRGGSADASGAVVLDDLVTQAQGILSTIDPAQLFHQD